MILDTSQHGARWDGRRVLVVGMGRTGLAVAQYLLAQGATVRATDREENLELPRGLEPVDYVPDAAPEALLQGVDLVVPSPGVAASAPVLLGARDRGIPVRSEIELGGEADLPMVAVTGTNGKSTTTELIAHILRRSGNRVFAGGNLGTPLVEVFSGDWDVAVVEVSSFQLEWVDTFRPRIGVVLNLTDDHLDRHGDLETYAQVKSRLLARQKNSDTAILNRDDARVARMAEGISSRVLTFGQSPLSGEGAELRGNGIRMLLEGEESYFSLDECPLLGAHNQENLQAAILASRAMRVSKPMIQSGIESFAALPHRMQEVLFRDGVRFIDDSKGTNVGALMRSIEGLPDGRVVLIAGGQDKGGDFSAARGLLAQKARCVALYGKAREILRQSWEGAVPLTSHADFSEAVETARGAARDGDVVLLSPACASFDQFGNYGERGDTFAALVRREG